MTVPLGGGAPPGAGSAVRERGAWARAAVCAGAIGVTTADAVAATLLVPAPPPAFAVPHVPGANPLWIVTAYAVPFAAVLASLAGSAGMRGGRGTLALGLGLFAAAAGAAAAAPSLPVLLLARAVQGVGAGVAAAAALGLLAAAARGRVAWAWPVAAWLGAAAAHAAGGRLTGATGPFPPSAALGLVLACLALAACRNPATVRRARPAGRSARRRRRLDLVAGMAALACGAAATGVVADVPRRGWTAVTLALCGAGLVMLLVVLARLARGPGRHPPAFRAAVVVAALLGPAAAAPLVAAPLLAGRVWGEGPATAALAVAPLSGGALVAALAAGRPAAGFGPRGVIYPGALGAAAACGWVATAALQPEPRALTAWLPATLLLGAGLGAMSTGVAIAVVRLAPAAEPTAALAGVTAAGLLGGAVGVAVTGAAVLPPPAGAGLSGHLVVFGGCMAAAGFAALASLPLRPAVAGTPHELAARPESPALLPPPAPPRPAPAMPLAAPVPGDLDPGDPEPPPADTGPDVADTSPTESTPTVTLRISGPHYPPSPPSSAPAPARSRPRPRRSGSGRHRRARNRKRAEGDLRTAAAGFIAATERLPVPPAAPRKSRPIRPGDADTPAVRPRSADVPAEDEHPPEPMPHRGSGDPV